MYTQLSHLALARARNEARHLNIGLTDTGHLLLALAQEKKALARKLMMRADIPPRKIEDHVERFYRMIAHLKRRSMEKAPPISSSLFLALEWAEEESLFRGHEKIGTPQLMLGLLQLESSSAARVLKRLGLSANQLVALISALRDEMEAAAGQASVQWFLTWYLKQQISQTRENAFKAFPSRSLRALLLKAKERALIRGLEIADPTHVLLAFLDEDKDMHLFMMEEGLDVDVLRKTAESMTCGLKNKREFTLRSGMIFLDSDIKAALSWAHGAACERNERVYGTMNLLSALLAHEGGEAAEIFRRSGMEPNEIRVLIKAWIERSYPSDN